MAWSWDFPGLPLRPAVLAAASHAATPAAMTAAATPKKARREKGA
jgi:hypothetical protein